MKDASNADKWRGFQIHAFTFVPTVILLVAINVWTGPPYWVLWVLFGWVVGLASHWFFVLGPGANKSGDS